MAKDMGNKPDAVTELADLRAQLEALVQEAGYAKGIKVIRAAKVQALLDGRQW